MAGRLASKRALVTGVTSGIGESTVLELARHGAEVILGARNPAKLEATIARIEKESAEKTGLRSDVVTLYQGGLYHLYRYKKYTDVRLVFAPEGDVAHFGGDACDGAQLRCLGNGDIGRHGRH